jgi:hypothetical protein
MTFGNHPNPWNPIAVAQGFSPPDLLMARLAHDISARTAGIMTPPVHILAPAVHIMEPTVHIFAPTHDILALTVHILAPTAQKIATRAAEFRFFALLPIFYGVKKAHPELLVGLHDKIRGILRHWVVVDDLLPPLRPLVLLEDVAREDLEGQLESLRKLGEEVQRREWYVKLARAAYERHKRTVHQWILDIDQWVWAFMQGTSWTKLLGLVPGLGQSYQHWWSGAHHAQAMWKLMVEEPPDISVGWPMEFREDCSLANYAAAVDAFEASWMALLGAGVRLKIARGALAKAQDKATACLMAYGHGVRARLLNNEAMLDSIPPLWPRRARPRGARVQFQGP